MNEESAAHNVKFETLAEYDSKPEHDNGRVQQSTPQGVDQISPTPWRWREPRSIPPRQWLYGRHYHKKFVSVTVAPGGVGKSSLTLVEAISICIGRDLLDGGKPTKRGKVWFYNGEDPREELDRRIAAICKHFGIKQDELDGRLFVATGRETAIELAKNIKGETIIAQSLVERLTDCIVANEIDLLIVDPFISSHTVNENDNSAIDVVARTLARIADEANVAVELVHHSRKQPPGASGPISADDGRGAGALVCRARSTRVLQRMTKDEAAKAGVENHRLFFAVELAKANLTAPSDKKAWRQLVSVGLGNGDNERPEDEVGVVTEWEWPDAFDGVTSQHLYEVQKAISKGDWRKDVRAKGWVGKAVAEVLQLDVEDAANKAKIKKVINTWIENDALKVVKKRENGRDVDFIKVGILAR